jgi:hypothetical protein
MSKPSDRELATSFTLWCKLLFFEEQVSEREFEEMSIDEKLDILRGLGQQYRAVVQIRSKYRGSVTTLVFGELKPHSGSLKEGRLDLVYYQNPGLNAGDLFPLWTLH